MLGVKARRGGRISPQDSNKMFVLLEKRKRKRKKKKKQRNKVATIIVMIKTISMTVCDNMLIRKQVCEKTVDCNTWLHIMKHIVKAIRPPECD